MTLRTTPIFIGWHDYFAVTGRLPLPAQVFQLWYFALNEEKLVPSANFDTIRAAFPALTKSDRAEQKRRLRRMVEKYRNDPKTLRDPRTENNPLCFPSSVFERAVESYRHGELDDGLCFRAPQNFLNRLCSVVPLRAMPRRRFL